MQDDETPAEATDAADEAPEAEAIDQAVAESPAEEADAIVEAEEPSEVANTIATMGLTRMSIKSI